ncbi:MAG: hypothetical protein ACJA0V_001686 [Planctomycetota bacterium]|jgi:hypothetical protein
MRRIRPVAITLLAALACSATVLAKQPVAQQPAEKSLEHWVTQLGSKQHGPRQEAYRALMSDRSPRIVALLGKQIESFAASSQQSACDLLRSLPVDDARVLYKQLLVAKAPFLRVVSAARLLPVAKQRAARKRSLQVLVTALADCPDSLKLSAVYACRQITDEVVLAELRQWLQPKQSSHIVIGVLRELLRRERGAAKATSLAVKSLLTSKDIRVQGAAHTYLLREEVKHEAQLAVLSKADPAIFWTVRDLLPTDGSYSDVIIAVIVAALRVPRSDRDVNQLAQLLKANSQAQLGKALRELLGHDKEDIRAAALKQLSTLRGGLENKDLMKLLRSEAVVARLVAADTMRRRDDRSGLAVVLQAVSKAAKHKAEAARVLSRFRSRQAMPLLLDLLDDADGQVRTAAWRGVQDTMRSLFPYRRFDFQSTGYDPRGTSRTGGIELLRTWWAGVK